MKKFILINVFVLLILTSYTQNKVGGIHIYNDKEIKVNYLLPKNYQHKSLNDSLKLFNGNIIQFKQYGYIETPYYLIDKIKVDTSIFILDKIQWISLDNNLYANTYSIFNNSSNLINCFTVGRYNLFKFTKTDTYYFNHIIVRKSGLIYFNYTKKLTVANKKNLYLDLKNDPLAIKELDKIKNVGFYKALSYFLSIASITSGSILQSSAEATTTTDKRETLEYKLGSSLVIMGVINIPITHYVGISRKEKHIINAVKTYNNNFHE